MAKNKKNNTKAKKKNTLVTPVVNSEDNKVEDVIVSDKAQNEEQVVPPITETASKEGKKKGKVVEVKAKDVSKKETKIKKPNKLVKSLKDTGNELKKVTWPSFKEVCKQTGIVLVVVLVFALVLFGIDRLCSLLTGLLF